MEAKRKLSKYKTEEKHKCLNVFLLEEDKDVPASSNNTPSATKGDNASLKCS